MKPNKIINLSDMQPDTLLYKIAKATIKHKGCYTYTDLNTNEKIKVI